MSARLDAIRAKYHPHWLDVDLDGPDPDLIIRQSDLVWLLERVDELEAEHAALHAEAAETERALMRRIDRMRYSATAREADRG